MGIEASYRRLTPQEFEQLRADPHRADSFFGLDLETDEEIDAFCEAMEVSDRHLDIDKDWQALHFLLTGRAEMDTTEVSPPLGNVVLGGMPTEWEATYGMVRYLTPQEVQDVSAALISLDEGDLRQRLDPAAFRTANIYPGGELWDADALESLLGTFAQVRDFFSAAARESEVVLLSSD